MPSSERPESRAGLRDRGIRPCCQYPSGSRLDSLVPFLPWFWLCGSLSTLVMLATGLIGVEQLRRSSRLVESGDLRGVAAHWPIHSGSPGE